MLLLLKYHYLVGIGLWWLTPLSTIFKLYRGGQFFGGGNGSTRIIQPTRPSQVTDKLYHVVLYRVHLTLTGVRTTLVVVGIDSPPCIFSRTKNSQNKGFFFILNVFHVFFWHKFEIK